MHHRLAANICLLNAWWARAVGKVLDHPSTEYGAAVRLPNDEMFIAKSLPFDILPARERMPPRQHDKQALVPKLGCVAIGRLACIRQERHIKAPLSNLRNMIGRCALDDLHSNVKMPLRIV